MCTGLFVVKRAAACAKPTRSEKSCLVSR
jgi:hypothetical protein